MSAEVSPVVAYRELDRILETLRADPSVDDIRRGIGALVGSYLHDAKDADSRAGLVNLADLLQRCTAYAATLANEVQHYATGEFDAECARDEALARVDDLEDRVEELSVENDALKAAAAARDSVLATAVAKACNGRQI